MNAKTHLAFLAVCALSLAANGCGNNICNVSIGSAKSAISRGNLCMQPGLVMLPDGNLLAAFNCTTWIMTQMSADNGVTWSPNTSIQLNSTAIALSLLPNGTVFLSTSLYSSTGGGVPTYIIGTIGSGDVMKWGSPVSVGTPAWAMGCFAVSPVVQLRNGSLLWPVYCSNNPINGFPSSSTVLLSLNGGRTWSKQVLVGNGVNADLDYDESAAVVFPDGDIVMIIRHTDSLVNDQYGSYWRSVSSDNGNTWSKPVEIVNNRYVGRPTLGLLPSGGLVLLGRADLADINTTAFGTSWNEGLTFSPFVGLEVDNVPDTMDVYDAMSLLPNGTLAVVTAHLNGWEGATNNDYRNLVDNCTSKLIHPNLKCARCPKD